VIRSFAFSKGALLIEVIAGSIYAVTSDTVFAALMGALIAGIPTAILLVKERGKDKAEERHLGATDDLAYADMVNDLLTEKSAWLLERGELLARIATLES